MSDCPYTGTTLINKEPWGDWPAGEDDEETQEEDQAEESDTDSEEYRETACSTTRAPEDSKSNTTRKPGLLNKIKRLFRK